MTRTPTCRTCGYDFPSTFDETNLTEQVDPLGDLQCNLCHLLDTAEELVFDYLSDIPDYEEWAGTGLNAARIRAIALTDIGPLTTFRWAVCVVIAAAVAEGTPVERALTEYEPERIAAYVLTGTER